MRYARSLEDVFGMSNPAPTFSAQVLACFSGPQDCSTDNLMLLQMQCSWSCHEEQATRPQEENAANAGNAE